MTFAMRSRTRIGRNFHVRQMSPSGRLAYEAVLVTHHARAASRVVNKRGREGSPAYCAGCGPCQIVPRMASGSARPFVNSTPQSRRLQ